MVCAVTMASAMASRPEPYAEWIAVDDLTGEKRDQVLSFRRSRVPSKSEVPFPRFPDARLLVGDTTPIATVKPRDRTPMLGLLLVSKADPTHVARWYEGKLPGYSRFEYMVEGKRKILFIQGLKSFDVDKDSHVLTSTPHVIVTEISSALRPLAVGYPTIIELSYRQWTKRARLE